MPPKDLSQWTPRERPRRELLEGRYVRLEPLGAAEHGDALFEASNTADADTRFLWLGEHAPASRAEFQPWLLKGEASLDPLYFTVVDRASGRIAGRQAFMRIDTANGVAEIGSICGTPLWLAGRRQPRRYTCSPAMCSTISGTDASSGNATTAIRR